MFVQNSVLRELILAYPEDAQISLVEQVRAGESIKRVPAGAVSVARALELLNEGDMGGIATRTRLRYLLPPLGVKVDPKLQAKQHVERPGHGVTAEDCRTVYSGDGNLALNYSHNFRVCGAYSPSVRAMTLVRQAVMLERSKQLRTAIALGEGIS